MQAGHCGAMVLHARQIAPRVKRYHKSKHDACVAAAERRDELLHAAAKQGYPPAMAELGLQFPTVTAESSMDGGQWQVVPEDPVPAPLHAQAEQREQELKWHEQAVQQGYLPSYTGAALCHLHGIGCEQDRAKAVELLQKAAEAGLTSAQYHLSVCFEKGWGVPVDKSKAGTWLDAAKDSAMWG